MNNSTESASANIAGALGEVLASDTLKRSEQLRAILKYLCEAAIEGRADGVTEYSIGTDVLHRDGSYSPAADSVVRTRVYELRQKLKHYYEFENPSAAIRVEIPKPGYVPRFVPAVPDVPKKKNSPRRWFVAAVVGICVILLGALWVTFRAERAAALGVWAPLIDRGGKPILICLGQPAPKSSGAGGAAALTKLDKTRVGTGAAIAMFNFGALFERFDVRSLFRTSYSTSFADLHHYPTVLLGGYSNPFTLEITRQLRYRFDDDNSTIFDGRQRSVRWRKLEDAAGNLLTDYGIVARLMANESRQAMIIAAGIEHCGTGASSELLSEGSPQLVSRLPSGWEKKSFEVVIRVRVVDGSCGAPEILQVEAW